MSDQDVFMVVTPFGDVAELGQGYINRADGERILLPLPTECPVGEGVRFIVQLADGTPAFAGAGRCVQVSDQGEGVAPNERFETLLDSLAFDERSQPVYEYIVAVRQAVYAEGAPAADGGEEPAAAEAPAEEAVQAEGADVSQEVTYGTEAEVEPEAVVQETLEVEASVTEETYEEEAVAESTRILSGDEVAVSFEARVESVAPQRMVSEAPVTYASVPAVAAVPEEAEAPPDYDASAFAVPALPSGMLQRATISVHWQPEAPRFPQASRRSGLFRYPAGPLPVPQLPPRPAMSAAARVSRAPAPR
jgi:hypothetical protein